MDNRGSRILPGGAASSPESALASELFDQFVSASTFKSVLSTYRQLCELLRLKPTNISSFYPRLKAKLHSWRAASLWAKLDKRASHKCYNRGKACPNTRVLLIGAGPCGLRAAIEAQLLGAKVVVVEKRDRFSRNNVLHLWPFVIHDLRNLGGKKFFGKFCAGSIDHISIRQLQIILLKVALILGVEVHENVGFARLKEPPEDQKQERIGWRACVNPADHPVSQYEFDVLIGADGKRNTLLGFNRKEFRGKLAIAVTANFINRHSLEEARVPEISGVAFIFNQKFFQDMREETGIDLENIVYYKDDTHYFVMTAKKQSLLDRGVIINDFNDTARLLSAENVDREALMEYAKDAADFATNYQLPSHDFAVNHYGQADVAMFDFTSMYAAENACRVTERRGHKLLQSLVGDSLLEPFWPTGSGCARGFLSSFDVAWMIRSWASGKFTHLQVLAEREAIYRLLAQTTPENLSKDLNQYTLNPTSRYPNLNLHSVLPSQVRSLYDTDGKIDDQIMDLPVEIPKKKRRRESIIHPDALLNWCQRQVAVHDNIKIENLSSSWKNGLALCAILHRYRPDLINVNSLNPEDAAKNNQLAFDICEKELGIPPVMTGQEMADCDVPDKLSMVSYLSQIYETFRGEIPVVCHPSVKSSSDDRAVSPNKQSFGTPRSILTKISNKFQNKRKYSLEKEAAKEKGNSLKRERHPPILHKRRSKEKDKGIALDLISNEIRLTNFKSVPVTVGSEIDTPKESINSRAKFLEMKMLRDSGLRCHLREENENTKATPLRSRSDHTELNIKLIQEQLQKNGSRKADRKSGRPKVGRLRKDEWNVKMLEEKINQQQKSVPKTTGAEKSKIFQEIYLNKLRLMDAKLKAGGSLTAEEKARFEEFDSSLSKLSERLTKGNLDGGERGHNQVAALTEHMSVIWEKKVGRKRDPLPPAPVMKNSCRSEALVPARGSEICFFCKKRVYLLERLSAEGLFFHRSCFKCEYCSDSLRLGNYIFDKDTICGGKFYCRPHFRMQRPDHRSQEMMKRKQAFLSNAVDEQEREKIYTTILANAEKALSPNKKTEDVKDEISVTDSPSIPSPTLSQDLNSHSFLKEPLSMFGRDQTPERVEYENSMLDYSEEELLTSELEEEELTQKNLGLSHDYVMSDDEYSDFSTDSESDEEAYAEELERSLTADETRKLAERWQRKYSTEHSILDSDASSSVDGDEVSDTEVGSEDGTSNDIDSDEEYDINENNNEDTSPETENLEGQKSKTPDVKNELTVQVPVIDLKGMNQDAKEDSSFESDISEESSGSDQVSGDSETEIDSESEPEPQLPPPQIPMIVIDESPPQDVDQEWAEDAVVQTYLEDDVASSAKAAVNVEDTITAHKLVAQACAVENADDDAAGSDSNQVLDSNTDEIHNNASNLSASLDVAYESSTVSVSKIVDGQSFPSGDSVDDDFILTPFSKDDLLCLNESSNEPEVDRSSLAKAPGKQLSKSDEDEQAMYTKHTVDGSSASIASESQSVVPLVKSEFTNIPSHDCPSTSSPQVIPEVHADSSFSQSDSLFMPDGFICSGVGGGGGIGDGESHLKISICNELEEEELPHVVSPPTTSTEKENAGKKTDSNPCHESLFTDHSNTVHEQTEICIVPDTPSDSIATAESLLESTKSVGFSDLKAKINDTEPANSEDVDSREIAVSPGYDETFKSISKEDDSSVSSSQHSQVGDFPFNPAFVTIRSKKEVSHNDSFTWSSDNSVSLPWFCDDNEEFDINVGCIVSPSTTSAEDSVLYRTANESAYVGEKQPRAPISAGPREVPNKLDLKLPVQSPLSAQNSSSEYFTPNVVQLSSTPIRPAEKMHTSDGVPNKAGLLTPISENDIKTILLADSDKQKNESPESAYVEIIGGKKDGSLANSLSSSRFPAVYSNESYRDASRCASSPNLSDKSYSPLSQSKGKAFDDSHNTSSESSSSKSGKFHGYSGSFAEKIRPKSSLGDTIYLRSLDINLQKQLFPSVTKSSDKLDDICAVDDCRIRKTLFYSSDKTLGQKSELSDSISKNFLRQSSVPSDSTIPNAASVEIAALPPLKIRDNSSEITKPNVQGNTNSSSKSKNTESVSTLIHESHGEPVSPYTYSQNRPNAVNIFPVKMRPKCDMDLAKLHEKREKRKSVHENIQGLPFADEEKAVTPGDAPSTPGNVFNVPSFHPEGSHEIQCEAQDQLSFSSQNKAQDKAREEARARARLKSDEELGLSPKNYRKKYQRQPSFSSIYYEELNSDEFYDHENEELEDEVIDGTFHAKRVEIVETQSDLSDVDPSNVEKISLKSSAESISSSHSVLVQSTEATNKSIIPTNSSMKEELSTPATAIPAKDSLTNKTLEIGTPPLKSSSNISEKMEPPPVVESIPEEEKYKSTNKGLFFSILNFSKGHGNKGRSNKSRPKDTEKELCPPFPSDLCVKHPVKQKPFSNLKVNKSKEKVTKEKQRPKHISLVSSDSPLTGSTSSDLVDVKSTQTVKVPQETKEVEEPKSILLNASQARIVPKYTVYRNPGVRLSAIPNHVPIEKTENGLAPKASEDSFSETEDDAQRGSGFKASPATTSEKKEKDLSEKEKKAQRMVQKVQKQQELKRLRTAQEIQRRLEELEVQQKELEQQGVKLEKAFRGEGKGLQSGAESDLMHEWYKLVHSKNQLAREEQELLIRLKDLELVDRQSRLQQEMRERMTQSASQKNSSQIGEEKKIITEMLRIVEERDELVAILDQLQLKEEEEEKNMEPLMLSQGSSSLLSTDKG